jgi:hypothetical protein
MNALRHGIFSPSPVVPPSERAGDWERHQAAVVDALAPMGAVENALAERVALLLWRLGRVVLYERESIAVGLEEIPADLHRRRRMEHLPVIGSMEAPDHPEDVIHRSKEAAKVRDLLEHMGGMGDGDHLDGEVALAALSCVEEAAEANLGDVSVPGIPDEAALEECSWTAGLFRRVISAVAADGDLDSECLLAAAIECARREERRLASGAKQVRTAIARMRRRRVLPDRLTLEKVARYEAHLDRLLARTLHEVATGSAPNLLTTA